MSLSSSSSSSRSTGFCRMATAPMSARALAGRLETKTMRAPGIFGKNISTSCCSVQSVHGIIHQHNVRAIDMISADRLRTGSNHFDHVMFGSIDQQSHRVADTRLIIGN